MKFLQFKGLAGMANLLGLAFLAIALILALTTPTVSAAPALQTGAATVTATMSTGTNATMTATPSTGTNATTTTTPSTTAPSTAPTTGTGDSSMALALITLVGLGFLGVGLALRAFTPNR